MEQTNEVFKSPFATVALHRLPRTNSQTKHLRAWDAADELILSHLSENHYLNTESQVLVINDSFGALSCSLANYAVSNWGDSYIGHLACAENLKSNHLPDSVDIIDSLAPPTGNYDIVIIKIPKTLALLEQQLISLKSCISSNTQVIAGGMVKYLQKSQQQLFEKYCGSCTTSLAVKKARLILAGTELIAEGATSPYPAETFYDEINLHISQHANVFSRDKLDIGTRFFLQQFKQLPKANTIVDLGCGNGILGIKAKQQQSDSRVYFVDESYMAVASARDNYFNPQNLDSQQDSDSDNFLVSNGLQQTSLDNIDLILCNPPFHQSNTVGDQIAWQMFKQSYKALGKGGKLWIVGNRNLGYHIKLKRLFGNCKTIASNKKFVVLEAGRQ